MYVYVFVYMILCTEFDSYMHDNGEHVKHQYSLYNPVVHTSELSEIKIFDTQQ